MTARKHKAIEGAKTATGDAGIFEAALLYPRGTTLAQGEGMAIGGLLGSAATGGQATGAGAAGGFIIGDAIANATSGMPPSVVLAVSTSTVHVLGRYTTSPLGGWDSMVPIGRFDRSGLRVEHHRSGALNVVKLIDASGRTTFEIEAKPVGNLGVTDLLAILEADK